MPNPFKLIKYELLYTDSITANGNPLFTQCQPLIHTMSTPYSHNVNPFLCTKHGNLYLFTIIYSVSITSFNLTQNKSSLTIIYFWKIDQG